MKINWLTEEYIKEQAKKGRKEALFCTRKHWWQLKSAGPRQSLEAINKGLVGFWCEFCALCYRYKKEKCKSCPLIKCGRPHSNTSWAKATLAYWNWEDEQTRTNWLKWKKASQRMYDRIDKICRRLYPAEFK